MPVIYTNGPEAALAQPRISDSASEPAQTSSEHLASSAGSGSGLPAGTVPVRGPASGFLAQLEANGLAAQSVPQPRAAAGGLAGVARGRKGSLHLRACAPAGMAGPGVLGCPPETYLPLLPGKNQSPQGCLGFLSFMLGVNGHKRSLIIDRKVIALLPLLEMR